MNEWVLYVMTWASQLSGYPLPDELPEVQWKSAAWFSHRVCEDHIPCPIFGLYEDADVIFLREELTDSAKDQVSEQHGIKVAVDKKSSLYLDGTTLDFMDELNQRGFKFNNPNVVKSCGCGSSFSA